MTIELAERFELIVRRGAALREVLRLPLGPPELDLRALALGGDLAFVGGDDGWIRRVDLATGHELDRWPAGAAITALAASADYVAIADATGAICLRRASGELLQCAALATAAIEGVALTITGVGTPDAAADTAADAADGAALVWSAPGAAPRGFALPALRAVAVPAHAQGSPRRWADHAISVDAAAGTVGWASDGGPRPLARLGGPVRAIATSRGGKLVIAGWVRALDQPSVIVWIRPPR